MRARTGLYVHIPFCRSKCSYCDFYSVPSRDLEDAYFERLLEEIRRSPFQGRKIDTLYFGGGTPSTVPADRIAQVMEALLGAFDLTGLEEATLELNPGTADLEKLRNYRGMGIDRLSVGVQSFDDSQLKRLSRIHTSEQVYATMEMARSAGFENLSLDLMIGLPGDSLQRVERDLEAAADLGVEHLSVYGLILEEGTSLMEDWKAGRVDLPGEEDLLVLRRRVNDALAARGYRRYEIANYARPGRESRHNQIYWNNDDYLGFGPGSTAKIGGVRTRTLPDLEAYCRPGAPFPIEETEAITPQMEREEGIFLGLRLTDGINLRKFRTRYGTDLEEAYKMVLEELTDLGAIEIVEGRLRLTEKGIDISNTCMARFLS